MSERLLIAVDESRASTLAVRYVGRLFEGSRRPTFVLLTVVEPPSVKMFQGAGVEGALGPIPSGASPSGSRTSIAEYAESRVRPILEESIASLESFGIAEDRIEGKWFVPGPGDDLEHGILREARKLDCNTIVVGRRALPWYRELFHTHVADKLARHARGQTLWIVESEEEE